MFHGSSDGNLSKTESKVLKRSTSFREKRKWRFGRCKSVIEDVPKEGFSWDRKDMYALVDNSLNDDGKWIAIVNDVGIV
jgi:hypothetical protein